MEKISLQSESDLTKAIGYFGEENKELIVQAICKYPCVLVGSYSEDVEFGERYDFGTVDMDDFNFKK